MIYKVTRFLTEPYRAVPPARLAAAFAAAVVNCAAILFILLHYEVLITRPAELLGCGAYFADLNIANRLGAVTFSLWWALISFHIFMTGLALAGPDEKDAHHALGYGLLPVLVWLAVSFFQPQEWVPPFWILFSCLLCWMVLLYFPLMFRRGGSSRAASLVVLSIGLSFFLAPALMIALKPLLIWLEPDRAARWLLSISRPLKTAFYFIPVLFIFLGLFLRDDRTIFRWVVFPVQVVLLLFFMAIVPGIYGGGRSVIRFYPAGPVFWCLTLPLFIIGLVDCARRVFPGRKPPSLSPFPLLSILFLFFWVDAPIPGFQSLYEFGSRLPEYWMVRQGAATLFKDIYITYGLWDMAGYWLTELLADFTAANTALGISLWTMIVLAAQFLSLAAVLPLAGAFLICFWVGVGAPSIPIIFFSILLIPALVKRPAAWITVWALLCGIAPFARIPQGTMCVVATIPAFAWQLGVLFRSDWKAGWLALGGMGFYSLLFFIWPLADYFYGLCRIFIETAHVNSPWAANAWNIHNAPFGGVVLGNALLVAPLAALAAAVVVCRYGRGKGLSFVAFLVITSVTFFTWSAVSYGFSRVDGFPYSRQLQIVLVMLPLILSALMIYVPNRKVFWACTAVILAFMTLHNLPKVPWVTIIGQPRTPAAMLARASVIPDLPKGMEDGARFGLPHVGKGRFPKGYLKEDQAAKAALDRLLEPDETFLDLTMEGLHYFSCQRPLVTEYPVYYVYPGDKPQFRAIEQLRRHQVKASLLQQYYFDNSPSALRTHYLYRYALLNGLPYKVTRFKTLLMPRQYFERSDIKPPVRAAALMLLDEQFPQTDLKYLPLVWGRGYDDLAEKLEPVRALEPVIRKRHMTRSSYHLAVEPSVQGTDAGLLILKADLAPDKIYNLTVRWKDDANDDVHNQLTMKARNGTLIIPLDASPRWLLGRGITSLEVDLYSSFTPKRPSISRAILMQRPMVNELGLNKPGPWSTLE